MSIFLNPTLRAFSSNGAIVGGAKLYTRLSGTSTPTATYSDSALSTAHANPIVANSAGVFPAIYVDPDINYRLILTDGTDSGNDPDQETDLLQGPIDNYRATQDLAYDYTIGASGSVGSSQSYPGPFAVRQHTFPDDFSGSRARLDTAPTAETVFAINVDGSSVGTITFATSSQTGVFASTGGTVTVNDGQYVDVVAPATTNGATVLRVTFKGTRVLS